MLNGGRCAYQVIKVDLTPDQRTKYRSFVKASYDLHNTALDFIKSAPNPEEISSSVLRKTPSLATKRKIFQGLDGVPERVLRYTTDSLYRHFFSGGYIKKRLFSVAEKNDLLTLTYPKDNAVSFNKERNSLFFSKLGEIVLPVKIFNVPILRYVIRKRKSQFFVEVLFKEDIDTHMLNKTKEMPASSIIQSLPPTYDINNVLKTFLNLSPKHHNIYSLYDIFCFFSKHYHNVTQPNSVGGKPKSQLKNFSSFICGAMSEIKNPTQPTDKNRFKSTFVNNVLQIDTDSWKCLVSYLHVIVKNYPKILLKNKDVILNQLPTDSIDFAINRIRSKLGSYLQPWCLLKFFPHIVKSAEFFSQNEPESLPKNYPISPIVCYYWRKDRKEALPKNPKTKLLETNNIIESVVKTESEIVREKTLKHIGSHSKEEFSNFLLTTSKLRDIISDPDTPDDLLKESMKRLSDLELEYLGR